MADDNGLNMAGLGVTIVALVVSLVALMGTAAQVLHQYLTTAVGYSNCSRRIMGSWARYTRRVFHPWELRFEVVFGSPLIFVTSPQSVIFPLRQPAFFLTGTEESTSESGIQLSSANRDAEYPASWLTLLSTVQDMEHQSNAWQTKVLVKQRLESVSRPWRRAVTEMRRAEAVEKKQSLDLRQTEELNRQLSRTGQGDWATVNHGIVVAVQNATQSLDLMPEGVKKPYGITTISDIVEVAAMLGVHWKQFDRATDRYIADGNGLLITGTHVPHLGIMFTVTRHGNPTFTHGRVIPCSDLSLLCFGFVRTILRDHDKLLNKQDMAEIPRDTMTLRLGSEVEVSETLSFIGCNPQIIKTFLAPASRTAHLLPLSFELLGMIATSLYVEGTLFRILPNPTRERWTTEFYLPWHLLREYHELFESVTYLDSEIQQMAYINNSVNALFHEEKDIDEVWYSCLGALHASIKGCDEYLLDMHLSWVVLPVLRSHLQHVITGLNSWDTEQTLSPETDEEKKFRDLFTTEPHTRPAILMNLYFGRILPAVTMDVLKICPGFGDPDWKDPDLEDQYKSKIVCTWCILVFRMICWLALHNFHRNDVQLPKSEIMGSKMPVYLS